jgi:2,4-dienoyl-CoA reductase-like NADH-dependent reductase (Old Yellow Enzyme family)
MARVFFCPALKERVVVGLFEPLAVRSVTLRNRIGVSPMCMYSSQDGFATDFHLAHLGKFALGGAGLVMTEATAVSPEGRITPHCAGIWSDAHIEAWARAARFVKEHGAVCGMQIAHAGRKAGMAPPHSWGSGMREAVPIEKGGWTPIAPTEAAFDARHATPRRMERDDIARVCADFGSAAHRALEAGFEWIELHFAHGYLAHEFLSPLVNDRDDEYGGSFENRIRFAVETASAVRRVWPERLPLAARLSCADWVEGGWDIEQSVELSRRLKAEGVDVIDCSSGFAIPGVEYPMSPGWQVPFAEQIRREAGVLTAAVGDITTAGQAAAIVDRGEADIVLVGREMLRDPFFAFRAWREAGGEGPGPIAAAYGWAV